MKRWLPWVAGIAVAAMSCASQQTTERPATQDNFGVRMAKENLWREAMFRFQRAVDINPGDAKAHNNLAVAYEANGDFEKARKEYLEALKLDRSNEYIKKNYSRFVEFLSRNRKRQEKEAATSKSAASTPSATANTAVPPPPISTAPAVAEPAKPVAMPASPPSDRPQPPVPQPQPPNPPGGVS